MDSMKSPSIRQKKVIKNILANTGSVSEAMREAGYSEGYVRNSQDLIKTKTFQELAAEILSDDKLMRVADEGLSATKLEAGEKIEDYAVRQRYLETSLKVRGLLIDRKDIQTGGKPFPLLGGLVDAISSNDGTEETPKAK